MWLTSGAENDAIFTALQKINKGIVSILRTYAPIPDPEGKVSAILNNGVDLYFRAYSDKITGTFNLEIKGSI